MAQQEQQGASSVLERAKKLAHQLEPIGVTVVAAKALSDSQSEVVIKLHDLYGAAQVGSHDTDAEIRKRLHTIVRALSRQAVAYCFNAYAPEVMGPAPAHWAAARAKWVEDRGVVDPNPEPIPFAGTVTVDEQGCFVTSVDLGQRS
jgi:hypothetical protein